VCFGSNIGKIVAHVRPGNCFDNLEAAVAGIGISNLTVADTLDMSVAKDCTSTVVACPMHTIWPLKCHTALKNLAEAIKKKRGLENVPERYRQPASFREVLASVQIRLDVPVSPLLNTQ
jgi:hypothetical protein